MQDLGEFVRFFGEYFKKKLLNFGQRFESAKNLIVAFLIAKRGKHSSSFLNTSFFLIVASAVIGGPIIAKNNPFIASLETISQTQKEMVSYNPYENSLTTVFSVKPRDKIIQYKVIGGDTLASIAKNFDITVDTIKWANNLKTDIIKPGQILKISPVTGVVHKVASGESIYTIAKKYKTDAQKIVNFPFNDFVDLDTFSLSVGQILYVPDGIIEEEQPRYLAQQLVTQIQAGAKGTSNFIWPTSGGITQSPVWYHMAVDIANSAAPAVIAADTGTVIYSSCERYDYGCHIVIDHGNGYQTLYAHLSSLLVSAGQVVGQGQQIGIMGSTGRSTGTHLHFEVRSNGSLLNPLSFLK